MGDSGPTELVAAFQLSRKSKKGMNITIQVVCTLLMLAFIIKGNSYFWFSLPHGALCFSLSGYIFQEMQVLGINLSCSTYTHEAPDVNLGFGYSASVLTSAHTWWLEKKSANTGGRIFIFKSDTTDTAGSMETVKNLNPSVQCDIDVAYLCSVNNWVGYWFSKTFKVKFVKHFYIFMNCQSVFIVTVSIGCVTES